MENNKEELHPFISEFWNSSKMQQGILSKWFINRKENNEVLSFAYIPSKEVKSIFLGTFPTADKESAKEKNETEKIKFFYGSTKNDFWNCLGNIAGNNTRDLTGRFHILDEHNFGITDILLSIKREKVECSSDTCLIAVNYNDIQNLEENFPSLENIFITSGGRSPIGKLSKSNKSVATWLKDSLKEIETEEFNKTGFVKRITVNNKIFNLIYLYSPSKAANKSIKRLLKKYNNFAMQDLEIKEFRELQWAYFLKEYHFKNASPINIDKIYKTVINTTKLLDFFNNK